MKKTETYGAVLAEIERLQQRAAELRKSELPGVVDRIRQAIDAYGLTAADLGFGGGAAPKAAAFPARRGGQATAKPAAKTGVPKYRDPKSGKTWTGRGKPPLWIAGVKDRTPYLIEGATGAPAEGAAAKAPAGSKVSPKAGAKRGRAGAGRKRAGRKSTPAPADAKGDSADSSAA